MAPPLAFSPHPSPLIEGRLVGRYDRFIADVELASGEVVHTHCVNPGRMEGLVRPGASVWISRAPEGRLRKLKYTWELIELEGRLVGANTNAPNGIVRTLLEARSLRGFMRWNELRAECSYGKGSRVDFWLREGRTEHFVEVKNCHLVYPDGRGYFPDSVSDRATRHLEELIAVADAGHRATVLFTIQDVTAECIRPSDLHDPVFAQTVRRAKQAGVRFRAVRVRPTRSGYVVEQTIPVDTKPYRTDRMVGWRLGRLPESGWLKRGPVSGLGPSPSAPR